MKVVDGDGFIALVPARDLGGETNDARIFPIHFRLGFVDAPEIDQPGGRQAMKFLIEKIERKHVYLEILFKQDTGKYFDRYNRMLCTPYIIKENRSDTRFPQKTYHPLQGELFEPIPEILNVELDMVTNGWAWVLERYGPNSSYINALNAARDRKCGIWALPGNIPPWEFKRERYKLKQATGTVTDSGSGTCPKHNCDGRLVQRDGKFGAFVGCSNFPSCRFSCSLINA